MQRTLSTILLLLSLLSPSFAQSDAAKTVSPTVRRIMPSGLHLLIANRKSELTAIALRIRVGGADETTENAGIAHLIEHLIFKGTDADHSTLSKVGAIDEAMENLGGEMIATTTKDGTVYTVTVPTKSTATALSILTMAVQYPAFRADDLAHEIRVIESEIAVARTEPNRGAVAALYAAAYPANDPNRFSLYGTIENLRRFTPSDLKTFHEHRYRPANMILAIAGNVDANEIEQAVGKLSPSATSADVLLDTMPKGTTAPATAAASLEDTVELPRRNDRDIATVGVGYRVPPRKTVGSQIAVACDALAVLLASDGGALLDSELRRRANLFSLTISWLDRRPETGGLFPFLLTVPNGKERAAENTLRDLLDNLKLTDTDLLRAKNLLQAHWNDETADVGEIAGRLAFYDGIDDDDLRTDYLKYVDTLTLETLQKTVRTIFVGVKPAVAILPGKIAKAATADPPTGVR